MEEGKAREAFVSANADQMAAGLGTLATVYGGYYRALVQAGLGRDQAFELVRQRDEMLLAHQLWPEGHRGHD